MQHLSDAEIVRLVADQLAEAQARAARDHIAACETCAARVREQERLWSALDAWGASSPARSVTEAVLAQVDQGEAVRPAVDARRVGWLQVGRLAASVLIAVGAGYGIGRWRVEQAERPQPVDSATTVAEVVDAFGLNVLASAPIGLADVVDDSGSEATRPGGPS